MKIKIITACDDKMKSLSNISFATIKDYCNFNNIDYKRVLIQNFERPASWFKIKLLLEEIKINQHNYVMWIDTDAIINNNNFDIKELLISNKEIYLSKDFNNFNCGVMILKNSRFNIDLLTKIWSMDEYLTNAWWEQAAFIDLYNENYKDLKNRVEIVPQNILNAYDYTFYGFDENKNGHYSESSFIVHFPALPFEIRKQRMEEILGDSRN
jgi:hypothetical protein